MRIASADGDVEHCQEYGVRGQQQHGIDAYARRRDGTYVVYQCKQLGEFGANDVRAAVKSFIKGAWADRAKRFVIVTNADVRDREIADAVETEAVKLGERGISLVPWGREELSTTLKDLPKIVDDFFGRVFVERLCGDEVARQLGRRLEHRDVVEFRRRLRELFREVFQLHDPGLALEEGPHPRAVPFEERFVPLDVLAQRVVTRAAVDAQPSDEREHGGSEPQRITDATSADTRRYDERTDLETFVAGADRSVLLAEAGAGKSTVLRSIALDLLSDSPRSAALVARWGDRLPVWLPFGFWTRAVAQTPGASLAECLHGWLRQYGGEDVWPLVERALDDDRVLLLVDGLDEWTTEEAARVAVDALQMFVDRRHAAAVVTARPYGYGITPITREGWQLGYVAPLSPAQVRAVTEQWFRARYQAQQEGSAPDERTTAA
ncbi:MAG: NACHT domain-containing protein [Chloroflexota bacterium]|nr:NACHT domain-containing protein [Chloroflexota bacterium]